MRFGGADRQLAGRDAGAGPRRVPGRASRDSAILDVGTGTGRAALALARRGASVTGVDASAEMLRVAQERAGAAGVTVTFEVGDAHALAFPDRAVRQRRQPARPDAHAGLAACASGSCAGSRATASCSTIRRRSSAAALQAGGAAAAGGLGRTVEAYRVLRHAARCATAVEACGFRIVGMHRQFVLPIALHKLIGSRAIHRGRRGRRWPRSACCACWGPRSPWWRCDARPSHRRDRVHGRPSGARAPGARARGARARASPRRQRRRARADGIELCEGDLRDRASLARAVDGVDVVYNIAAIYRQAAVRPPSMRPSTPGRSRALVEAAAAAGVRRVVHCSTVGVHGDVEHPPANEDAPLRPGDEYQRSKLEGERLARAAAARTGLELVIARPSGIYGPGDRRLLKLFRGVARRRFVTLGPGEIFYHLTYIDDLVEGFRLCGEAPGGGGPHLHPGRRRGDALNELVALIADEAGVRPPRLHLPVWPFWVAGALCEAVCVPLGIEPPLYRRRVDFFTKSRAFDIVRAPRGAAAFAAVGLREGIGRRWRIRPRRCDRGTGDAEGVAPVMAEHSEGAGAVVRRAVVRARRSTPRSSSGGPASWALLKHELVTLVSQAVPGALGLVLRKLLYPRLLGRLRPQRRLRPERGAAASGQDPHRRQRRHRRQLPARRQGRHQRGHHDRQRRVRRPEHDPVVQERRHRARRPREHRLQLRGVLGEPRHARAPTRCWPPTAT